MKRLLLALAVFLSLAAQETTLPKDHYCMQGDPPNDRGHACACKLICDVDEHGTVTDRESGDCKLYCRRDKCLCHADADKCHTPKG